MRFGGPVEVRRWGEMRRWCEVRRWGGLGLLLLLACGSDEAPVSADNPCRFSQDLDQATSPAIHTPRWAFEPWISKDISSTDDTYAFVAGFRERDIPVGVVVLDSPWETHYNTFVPHPERYHHFAELVDDLAADDIRVVLWMTQMVNTQSFDFEDGGDSYAGPSPNHQQGLDCHFYIEDGASFGWWKGVGSAVDFFHPEARAWWHRQQDPLFELGVSGFKLDFGDSYVRLDSVDTASGPVDHQAYSEAYYQDFFSYGAAQRGIDAFVTMVRPYDESYDFDGRFFARPEHAPVGWVGDNRRDWLGLSDALDHIFRSADAGYVVLGSDIGGYLDADDQNLSDKVPFDTLVFQRWTALGALTPFMQLHGRANITPWTVPGDVDENVAVYRYWSHLHHQLVPFFYSLAEQAYAGGSQLLTPLGAESDWPGDYRFLLGEALLVAPILDASGVRNVELPAGSWYDWWAPDGAAIAGGATLLDYDASEIGRVPLFVKQGAIVPLSDANEITGLGTLASRDAWTILVYPAPTPTSFVVHDDDDLLTHIEASATASEISIALDRLPAVTYLAIRSESMPAAVTTDSPLVEQADRASLDAASSGWLYDPTTRRAWVKLPPTSTGATVTVAFP